MEKNLKQNLLDNIKLDEFVINDIDIEDIKNKNWIIDDIEYFVQRGYDEKILNLINIILSVKDSFVLITSKTPPKSSE